MATTREEFFRVLKEIRDTISAQKHAVVISKGGSTAGIQTTLSSILTSVDGLEGFTDGLEALLTTLDAVVDSLLTNSNLLVSDVDEIRISNGVIQLAVDGLESLLTQIENNTDGIESRLDTVNTNLGTMETDLESIDDNWNLLSLNQLNLAAILVAVLNNATSGRQDTANTRLQEIENNTDGLEGNTANLEARLDTIITHVDGLEGLLTTIDGVLDKILDQSYETPSLDVEVLTMTDGDLTKTQSITVGQLNELQALTIVGEATASRTITFSIVINSTVVGIIDIVVANGTTVLLSDSKWDAARSIMLNLKLHSTGEIRTVASAVTSSESVIVNIGMVKRNS